MLDPKSVELIDTCRPDGRDVQSPELAALLAADPEARAVCERVQQLDARFASAMHEVAVPGDLAARILERLAAAAATAAPSAVEVAAAVPIAPAADAPGVAIAERPRAIGRRRWLAIGLAVAASLLVAVGIGVWNQPDKPQGSLTDRAVGWYEQLGDGWQPVAKAPREFALPKGIGGSAGGWQRVAPSIARGGVVYDLGQFGAVLFVIKATGPDLPSSAPQMPQSMTAGYAIGAWQKGGLMYVLVVRGNQQTYQKLLRPAPPLA